MGFKIKNILNKSIYNKYNKYKLLKQSDISCCVDCKLKPTYMAYNETDKKNKITDYKLFTICPETKQEFAFFTKYKKTYCEKCIQTNKAKIFKIKYNIPNFFTSIKKLLGFNKPERILTNPNTVVMKNINIDDAYNFIKKYEGVSKIADYEKYKIKLTNKRNKVFAENYTLNKKKPMCSICEAKVEFISIEKIIGDNNYHFNYYCLRNDKHTPMNVDHIHPVSHKGSNRNNNLQLTCLYCNLKKGDETFLQL